jgi:hypothetical protein
MKLRDLTGSRSEMNMVIMTSIILPVTRDFVQATDDWLFETLLEKVGAWLDIELR